MVRHTAERPLGQVLVVVALGLVALVAFVGLAVDGGNLYSQRRAMQNAADAGALAGAGEICYGDPAIAATTAISYATHLNGADEDATTATVDGHIVTVDAGRAVDTFFARIIGFETVDVTASARAACGKAISGTGLWPVALPHAVWEEDLYRDGAGCSNQGVTFQVWDDGQIPSAGSGGAGERGWLDFTAVPVEPPFTQNCSFGGGAALKCYVRHDFPGMIDIPSCIPGKMGVDNAATQQAEFRIGELLLVPLYEDYGGDCGHKTFSIVGFACARVVDVKDTGNPKYIEMEIDCEGCAAKYGSTDGTPGEEWEVRAVSLIE